VKLTSAQLDRACGTLLGTAIGDALGAGYEFGAAPIGSQGPQMIGGGLGDFAPGEWTDDTSMAWCIGEVAATGADLRSNEALDAIAAGFRAWYETRPRDIGIQTRRVLSAAGPAPTAAGLSKAAAELHQTTGRSAGNGSLMRTAAVALAHLDSVEAVAAAARKISELTHFDPDAGDACVLWSIAIRHAILKGEFSLEEGFGLLPPERAGRWRDLVATAESEDPSMFTPNGWVVTAFQAAWSAIVHTQQIDCSHFGTALGRAIRIGDDTDTIGAIAGALLGARWGVSAIPAGWRRISHGYPGIAGERLIELAALAGNKGPVVYGWPGAKRIDYSVFRTGNPPVRHPYDAGVWLSDASALDDPPSDVTAVVSLCLVGNAQIRPGLKHVKFRLIDRPESEQNPNLEFVLTDAAKTVAALRAEGHVVLLHCVAAQSRTPSVAIAYAMQLGIDRTVASDAVCSALPRANLNPGFAAALKRLEPSPSLLPVRRSP